LPPPRLVRPLDRRRLLPADGVDDQRGEAQGAATQARAGRRRARTRGPSPHPRRPRPRRGHPRRPHAMRLERPTLGTKKGALALGRLPVAAYDLDYRIEEIERLESDEFTVLCLLPPGSIALAALWFAFFGTTPVVVPPVLGLAIALVFVV